MRSDNRMRFSTKAPTSEVAVPRNADLLTTLPIDHRPIVVDAVTIVVDAGRRIEWTRRSRIDTVPAVKSHGNR